MKRNLTKILSLCILATLAFSLGACDNTPEHTHTFSTEWKYDETYHWHEATCEHTEEVSEKATHTWDSGKVITEALCESEGLLTYTCTVCGATKDEVIAEKGHSFSDEWSSNATHHWHAATCEHKEEVSARAEHEFVDGKCTVCDTVEPITDGLAYTLINNDSEYQVSGIGTVTDLDIYIPSSYNNLPVTSIGDNAFNISNAFIRSISIPDSVKNIGERAFFNLRRLTTITIGKGVETIGLNAFSSCTSLIEIYNRSTLNLTVGTNGYGDLAYSAKRVHTDGYSYLSDDKDGYRFYYEDNKGYLVGYFGEDTDLNLPKTFLSYNGVEVNEYEINQFAFYSNIALTGVSIPSSVKVIGNNAFGYSRSISRITIEEGVTTIGNSALQGTSITTIVIPDSVTTIGDRAFSNSTRLLDVTLGSGVTTIGTSAFQYCERMLEVYNKSSLTLTLGSEEHGYIAYYVKHIYTQEGMTWFAVSRDDGYRFFYDGTTGYLVEYSGSETEITLPESFTTTYYNAVVNEYVLYKSLFYGNSEITSVMLPSSVTAIENGVFSGCSGLTSINIPNSVTSIGSSAFNGCSGLTSINLGNSLTSIGNYAFNGCGGLTILTLPDTVTSIGSNAFYNCTNLTSVNIPNGVTTISNHTFYRCSSLRSIDLPNTITSIGNYAFYECVSLTELIIPTNVKTLGNNVFASCSGITSLIVPSSVETVEGGTFSQMKNLVAIYYCGTESQWSNLMAQHYQVIQATIYIYSETRPTSEGNYWHYAEDGVTPEIW